MPPWLSISFRTTVIQASISSALSSTSRKLAADLRTALFCDRSREMSEFLGPASMDPSSEAWLEICSTQCFPGIKSHAKAADSLPSFSTFSGDRSNEPSPAYCKTYPAVTRMYILLTNSGAGGFRTEFDISRLCVFSNRLASEPSSEMTDKSRVLSILSRIISACLL